MIYDIYSHLLQNLPKWLKNDILINDFTGFTLSFISTIGCLGYAKWSRYLLQQYQIHERKLLRATKPKNVNFGAIFGMDIGGTLTKIVYFESYQNMNSRSSNTPKISSSPSQAINLSTEKRSLSRNPSFAQLDNPEHKEALDELYKYMDTEQLDVVTRDEKLSFESPLLGGRLHFLHFETRNMMEAIDYVSATALTENISTIGCTGGGSHKYANSFADKLQIKVIPFDELDCLVIGMDFALSSVRNECYTYRSIETPIDNENISQTEKEHRHKAKLDARWQKDNKDNITQVYIPHEIFSSNIIFPYLIVNIGSGVSILKVTSPGKFERVSGSSLGGGTYWGLCRLLTSCSTYENVLDLAETGNAAEVDMLVRDIYGGSYDNRNLNSAMVASSFGKLVMKENPRAGIKEEDLALALLMMITNNIGQVAYLNAQLHGCSRIFFVGSFLRHNAISCRRLAFAIDFWSNCKMEALFLKHEGYFGSLGTFLQSGFTNDLHWHLKENYSTRNMNTTMSSSNEKTPMKTKDNDKSNSWYHFLQKINSSNSVSSTASNSSSNMNLFPNESLSNNLGDLSDSLDSKPSRRNSL